MSSKSLLSSTLTSTSRGSAPTRYALPSWLVGRAIPFSSCGFHDGHFSVFSHLIFQIRSQGRLESEIRKIVQIRKSVSRRRSQTSTAKHSRPIPNHLNGSRSSKIVDAHLRMSLRDVPCVSADSGKSPIRGRLRRRPLACEKLFWGYGGLPPWIGFG